MEGSGLPNGGSGIPEGRVAEHMHSAPKSSWRETKKGRSVLKGTSVATGFCLLVGGLIGLSGLFFGQWVYFLGSIYTVCFGLVVLVTEARGNISADNRFKLFIEIYLRFIEIYLRFLTLQRGKGLFYLGVGLLVFCIAPGDYHKTIGGGSHEVCNGPNNTCYTFQDERHETLVVTNNWGVNNIAALLLIAVGCMHTLRIIKEEEVVPMSAADFR